MVNKNLYLYTIEHKGSHTSSLSVVKVIYEFDDKACISFVDVIQDNTGNNLFHYLWSVNKTMNVSKKYLEKLPCYDYDFINEICMFTKVTYLADCRKGVKSL